jgi:diketogulonate reductase-like aldo/keto reductase
MLENVSIPGFLYGTAWKEDRTEKLTYQALQAGLRGIDTANQRKHYYEAGVGAALARAFADGLCTRDQLFLQTKYTFRRGQDTRLPYDEQAPITTQVAQSFASSLEHLGVDYLDSYILHGPSRSSGLGPDDWDAWQAMEALHDSGQVRLLGVSNVGVDQVDLLCRRARIRPHFVQNRCYAQLGWDREMRQLCDEQGIVYQGFSLLTANRAVLGDPYVMSLAQNYHALPAQIVFRFAMDVGMLPLTGTTSEAHMQKDLAVADFQLMPDEVARLESLAG